MDDGQETPPTRLRPFAGATEEQQQEPGPFGQMEAELAGTKRGPAPPENPLAFLIAIAIVAFVVAIAAHLGWELVG